MNKMDAFQTSMLKYMTELTSEINKIKEDVADIKANIADLKGEQEEFMKGFPYGIEDHKNDHIKRRKWFLF